MLVQFSVYKISPIVPIIKHINPVFVSHPIYLKLILELSCHLCLGLRNGLLPSGFPISTLYAFLFFTLCTTYPTISFSKCVYMDKIFL